ncbi:MAG: hypothetical protein ACI39E_00425 [Acutalibacteraceae bacterium]
MRKTVSALLSTSICLLMVVMLAACNAEEEKSNVPKAKCEDCGASMPEYCVNYRTDNEAYYCFDCYWENHSFEKNVFQISYEKWW